MDKMVRMRESTRDALLSLRKEKESADEVVRQILGLEDKVVYSELDALRDSIIAKARARAEEREKIIWDQAQADLAKKMKALGLDEG